MDNSQKIKAIISEYRLKSQAALAKKLDISPQLLAYWIKSNFMDIDKIKSVFPDISSDWLLTGEGQMLNKVSNSTVGSNSPIVNSTGDGNHFTQRVECAEVIKAKDELISQLRGEVEYLRNLTQTMMNK